ncbi:glycosyltransferase [Agrococcus casei]|uniref:D-inositol 3-phosphate glycosyltransferase n=1 Tax=Agrococcus casei LMG 22410 TaxID=1255656 RepID=A0A1R4FBR4_9MICO|nr:glycosyltransferase [Agrococcus casei]SJM53317.1 COG0438: Glycosyltransferase [Agrococcus casei LMG 22410]
MRNRIARMGRRLLNRLSPQNTADESLALRQAESDALLQQAQELATTGKHSRATPIFREAIHIAPDSGRAAVAFARYLISQSNGAGAEEVLAATLFHNGANPDAVELYVEIANTLDRSTASVDWAMNRLVADLNDHPEAHRGSLDFVISRQLKAAYPILSSSRDQVSRVTMTLNAAFESGTADETTQNEITGELPPAEANRALAITLLGRGKTSAAVSLLSSMEPNSIPMNSLRRAIRRALQRDNDKQARKYLEAYLRVSPQDGWATRTLKGIKEPGFSNYQLGKRGFPFPKAKKSPIYEPNDQLVFYLLHNSLPHNSAGYATRTHGLLKALNFDGWDVDGVTRLGYPYDMPGKADIDDVPPIDTVDGVDYLRLLAGRELEKKNPLYDYVQRYSSALIDLAKRERPAIMHAASNHWNGLTAVSAANQLGIPSIYEVRGLWEVTRGSRNPDWAQGNMFRYIARMEADAARGATRVFTITNALRQEMVSRGVDEHKITVLPNGVDTSRFAPLDRDEELAAELGVKDKTVIGYIGSILDYEGLELLIDAASRMASKRTDFHLLFVGDGAELDFFQDRVENDGLGDVITFTGRVPHEDVERYYSLVDIAPFPRLPLPVCEMVSPLKPFEAMAMGKAVVASNVAALAEIITPGLNGLLHDKGDSHSLQAQLELLLNDQELTKRLGEQAREWVVANRDWSSIAKTVSETYAELTGKTTATRVS